MFTKLVAVLASVSLAPATGIPSMYRRSGTISVTPHEQYSSSVGVVGCKINTNRVAYWPGNVGCDDFCVRVSYEGRSLILLKIDTSGGAHDISYDAWNYLGFGVSAIDDPRIGGGIAMEYETVAPDNCADLLDGGQMPLLAANSINFLSTCLQQPDSYVAQNFKLLNILDPVCHWGVDEECELDLDVSNQPRCPSGLGNNSPLDLPVWNVQYGTGELVRA